jgi:hypothetical protein
MSLNAFVSQVLVANLSATPLYYGLPPAGYAAVGMGTRLAAGFSALRKDGGVGHTGQDPFLLSSDDPDAPAARLAFSDDGESFSAPVAIAPGAASILELPQLDPERSTVELVVHATLAPPALRRAPLVTVTPRFVVRNRASAPLRVAQARRPPRRPA